MNKKPIISVVIISYNQEKYIREAIESALAQDYELLEVVISDDLSEDNTWNIILEIKENYNGLHKFIVNRNEKNLGIVGNFFKALNLCHGDWIVVLAGDDVAYQHRSSTIYALSITEEDIYAIGTGFDIIDRNGKFIGSVRNSANKNNIDLPFFAGSTAAFRRECITNYPEISCRLWSEDIIFSIRAFQSGKILLTDIPTVKHRVHDSNAAASFGFSKKAYLSEINNLRGAIETLEYCRNVEVEHESRILQKAIDYNLKRFHNLIDFNLKLASVYDIGICRTMYEVFRLKLCNRGVAHKCWFKLKLITSAIPPLNIFYTLLVKLRMLWFLTNSDHLKCNDPKNYIYDIDKFV